MLDEDIRFSFDAIDLDEEKAYIVHIHLDNGDIDIFEKKEEGTPISFSNEADDENEDNKNVWDPSSYVLPALYTIDQKGKERIWKIWVVKATVYKSYGETKGALTPSFRTFNGVNDGKKNSTTPEEQAKREAERDWVKQLDKDYHPKTKEGLELEKRVMAAKKKQGGVNVNIDAIIRNRGGEIEKDGSFAGKKGNGDEGKDANEGEDEEDNTPEVLPMHCQPWLFEPKCLKYFDFDNGVYIQPKLDGIRCLARIKNGKVFLLTRQGKEMQWLNHLRDEIKLFLTGKDTALYLDGEIYAHSITGTANYDEKKKKYTYVAVEDGEKEESPELDVEQRFDVISGAARPKRNTPHPLEGQLCLHVFDIADPSGELDQDQRFEILKRLFSSPIAKSGRCSHIRRVETKVIYYVEEIEDYHDEAAQEDYEGVVLRARDLYYESHNKSLRMRKYKHFIDEEYPITDILCANGVGRENFRWVCEKIVESPDTGEQILTTFKAKPMGTREQRWHWYDNSDEYLGKLLNVRYQHLSYEGVPRFPRGTHIRDYDDVNPS